MEKDFLAALQVACTHQPVKINSLVVDVHASSRTPMVGRVITFIGTTKARVAWGSERDESFPLMDVELLSDLKVVGRYTEKGREIMYDDESAAEIVSSLKNRGQTVIRGRRLTNEEAALALNDIGVGLQAMFSTAANPRWPAQPPVGTILRFERTFKASAGAVGNQPVYTYVALRVDDRWYVTGRNQDIVSWEELMKKIGDSPCHIVTQYQEIPRPAPDPREVMDPQLWFTTVFGGGVEDHDQTEADAKAKKK